jgi:hypothetical protein
MTKARAISSRAISSCVRRPIPWPTLSRRIVTGLSTMICERSRKPDASPGSIVTRKSGASAKVVVI